MWLTGKHFFFLLHNLSYLWLPCQHYVYHMYITCISHVYHMYITCLSHDIVILYTELEHYELVIGFLLSMVRVSSQSLSTMQLESFSHLVVLLLLRLVRACSAEEVSNI